MIKVYLKSPYREIFVEGDLGSDIMKKKMSDLFMKPDMNVLMGDIVVIKQSESAPYELDYKNPVKGGIVLIPASNIAYMKNVKED